MAELPPDIVTDVLIRLPVKSLLRFRCVSKPLCSQIDTPDFTKLHLNHSTRRHLVISRVPACKLYSLDLPSLHQQPREIANPLATDDDSNSDIAAQVIGSCNGLICIFKSHTQISICNPSTRKQIHLQPPPTTDTTNHSVVYGFGYDSLRDDYKLLRITQLHGASQAEAYVCSMKSNLWRKIKGFPFRFYPSSFGGMFVSGSLYFTARRAPAQDRRFGRLVIAVDLEDPEEEYPCREVGTPPERIDEIYSNLGVFNGRLCLLRYLSNGFAYVRVMEQNGAMESWTMWLRFSPSEEDVSDLDIKLVTMSSNGSEVILHSRGDQLFSYHLTKHFVEMLKVFGGHSSFEADVYVESLVNPAGP